ncbi:MAG TPA: glycosyltransferase family 2 protein [Candidatus Saccharimonadales bacterium]|nr:glycosyltransferase family 2 protein [Candidatus Saccharimonadales bacterium]
MKSTKSPRVVFVIVGWNNRKLLADCFDSLASQTYSELGVIYLDNNSSDGSAAWVRENYPDVTVVEPGDNTGFAKGNNLGIALALEDPSVRYVGLLNTDARLAPDWVERVVRFADTKPKGACYQGTTLNYNDRGRIDSTHIFAARNGQGTQGNWRSYAVHELGPKKVFGVNAAACVISRSFIEAQPFRDQVFDEAMYMYLEDVDLAARSTVMGWDNYLVPGARAYHMGSVSSKSIGSSFSLYMTFRNNSAMLYKNFPWRLLFKMTARVIRGDIDTIISLWQADRKKEIGSMLRGRLVGIIRIPLFMLKRFKVSRVRQVDSDYLWQLMKEGY